MEDLPDNVMVEILSRLPVKTIIHCKSVCKKWQNIVSSDSYFADLQHSRSPAGFMVRRRFIKQGVWKWVEVSVTGQWRSLGHVPYSFINICGQFFNGHGHWIICDQDSSEKICVFDYDKEKFELFPSPPYEGIEERQFCSPSLVVLKGCLCRYDEYDSNLTVWMMKEYGIKNSWHKELVIEFGIPPDLDMLDFVHDRVVEGFKDGTFLMTSCTINNLYVYCPRRKMIVDADVCDGCVNGFAYRPSFHRLQTLLNSDNERVHAF